MQVLNAGLHKLLLLELDTDFISNIAKQAGFEFKLEEGPRSLMLDLTAPDRQVPLTAVRCCGSGQSGLVLPLPILCRWKYWRDPADSDNHRESEGSQRARLADRYPAEDRQGNPRATSGFQANSQLTNKCFTLCCITY